MQLSTTTGICCPELWRREMSREGDERVRLRRGKQIETRRKKVTKKKKRYNRKKNV